PGEQYAASGSFTDPGADPWTAAVDYGDGSGLQPLPLTGQTFALSHTYTTVGTFTVTVQVADDHTTSVAKQTVAVISLSQGVRNAIAIVDQLAAAGKITANVATVLRLELQLAAASFDAGLPVVAVAELRAVVIEIDLLVQLGKLSAADAAPLRSLVTRVIRSANVPIPGPRWPGPQWRSEGRTSLADQELVALGIEEDRERAPRLLLRRRHELDALVAQLGVGPLEVVDREREVDLLADHVLVLVGCEQYELGLGIGDLELDPALIIAERLIGEHREAEPLGVELEGALLVGARDADKTDVLDHGRTSNARPPR